ncbi:MAG: fumarylacetoacetate hydrolase family protein [Asgard group archaeon]|nr:fumarylacetoacetate hydrolase family protein [Asgard group archaeon]
MKIFRFKNKDELERIGVFWNDSIVDILATDLNLSNQLFDYVSEINDLFKKDDYLSRLQQFLSVLNQYRHDQETIITFSEDEIKYLPPITNPEKIICLGRNFAEHAKEGGKEPPKNPMIWGKFNSAIIGHQEPIEIPKISEKVDVEIELVVVMGKGGKHIPKDKALEHIFGYTIGNDVTARDYQYTDKQFTRAKTMDTFAPLGPWIITSDELKDPQNLEMVLKVNGKTWQKSNTKQMIFSIAYIISYLSKSFTFKPGDLIFTGTPSGVGHYQKPPVYLKSGDVVSLSIDKIGVLENPVINEE